MAEHSPGPWTWDATYEEAWGPAIHAGERHEEADGFIWWEDHVASVPGLGRDEAAKADARLIAAAPELLAACEEIVRVTHPGDPGRWEARTAIAKARGKQEAAQAESPSRSWLDPGDWSEF